MSAALNLSSVINRSGTTFGGVPVPRFAPLALALLLQSAASANAQDSAVLSSGPTHAAVPPGSINCEECPYPRPSKYLDIQVYTQDARIAYMDVPAEGAANGHTVLLLHGNNFGGFYFTAVIDALRKAGFRVVVPDQIGYGRSSKPVA